MEQILVDGREEDMIKEALNDGLERIKNPKGKDFALIITGDALITGMNPLYSKKIMEIGERCKAVVACRVSPKQKQEVVSLVRREVRFKTNQLLNNIALNLTNTQETNSINPSNR